VVILQRDKKNKETANAQNSTFASSDTLADASACKRAVFLPSHRSIDELYRFIERINFK